MGRIFVWIATRIVRLVAPRWEHENLPAWIGLRVLLAAAAIAIWILQVYG